MSYVVRHTPLGITADEILRKAVEYGPKAIDYLETAVKYAPQAADLLKKAPKIFDAARAVVADPYLPELTCQVLRLNAMAAGKKPGPACKKTVATEAAMRKGIGLHYAATPVRAFVAMRERPWLLPVAVAALVGIPLFIGYRMGKGSR